MTRVIPKYVPANASEDRFGFLVAAKTAEDGARVYLSRDGDWSGVADAMFFAQAILAADELKEASDPERLESAGIAPDSIGLMRVVAFLIPTEISESELRQKRREMAVSKLTDDELEALGMDRATATLSPDKRRQAALKK